MVIMNNTNTTERLIQEVRARPPLWDQRNLNYHNRVVVNALWQDIADSLQINKETVKVKWKGLRDTYRRELKKQRNNANSSVVSENIRDPSWTHYSSMNFLREYMGNNNNNNHNDIFQFHGWSAEEIPSADEASTTNDETLGTFVPTVSISDLVGGDASPNAVSVRSGDSTSEDENVKTAVKAEPRSPEATEKDKSHDQRADVKNEDTINTANNVSIISNASKNGEKERSSTSSSRFSRKKEYHRLRSKSSKKRVKNHHSEAPKLTTNNDDVDMAETPTPTAAALSTHASSRRGSTNSDESDDDLYFFKSLIPFVRNLPPTRKLYLRAEIHNLVLRELMSDGSSNSVIPLEHVAVGLNA